MSRRWFGLVSENLRRGNSVCTTSLTLCAKEPDSRFPVPACACRQSWERGASLRNWEGPDQERGGGGYSEVFVNVWLAGKRWHSQLRAQLREFGRTCPCGHHPSRDSECPPRPRSGAEFPHAPASAVRPQYDGRACPFAANLKTRYKTQMKHCSHLSSHLVLPVPLTGDQTELHG